MIVGLCGHAGAGKSTVASLLVRDHGFVEVALADPLKRFCKEAFAFSDDALWGPSEKRNEPDPRYWRDCSRCQGKGTLRNLSFEDDTCEACKGEKGSYLTPRHALQQLGTEFGRRCYENVWIDLALRTARAIAEDGVAYSSERGLGDGACRIALGPRDVVISDVRFRNEVEAIRAAGGKVVRIHRRAEGLEGARGQHLSETDLVGLPNKAFDFHLGNDGSLEGLAWLVNGTLVALQGKTRPVRRPAPPPPEALSGASPLPPEAASAPETRARSEREEALRAENLALQKQITTGRAILQDILGVCQKCEMPGCVAFATRTDARYRTYLLCDAHSAGALFKDFPEAESLRALAAWLKAVPQEGSR